MSLEELLAQTKSLLSIEVNDYKELNEELLEKFKNTIGISEISKCFYNDSNLILTDKNTYNSVKSKIEKFEDILSLEIPKFDLYCFLGSYINCSELKSLFWTKA